MHVDPPTDGPTLPILDRGVYVLDADDRATGALQSLVLDHLLMNDGPALWVDSRGNATTQPLARLTPSDRLLDRIRVARGFTPFQHYSLVKTLPDHWTDETALVVLPEVDWFYRQDDLARGEGAELFAAAVATIRNLIDRTDVPVLATRMAADELTCLRAQASPFTVDTEVKCEIPQRTIYFSSKGQHIGDRTSSDHRLRREFLSFSGNRVTCLSGEGPLTGADCPGREPFFDQP